jgi:hypothetical protein
LFLQLCHSLFSALTTFHHKANFGLQTADFGAGLVKQALRLVDLIARRVMRLTNGFQIGFNVTQVGDA